MAATKEYFDKLMENQNKLVSSIAEYADEVVEVAVPDPKIAEKTEAFMKECIDSSVAFTEELHKKENLEKFQEDFWGTMTENYTNGLRLSTDLYGKTMTFFKEMWTNTSVENQEEKMKHCGELYQHCWQTYLDVTKDNAKIMQDFFTETNKQ